MGIAQSQLAALLAARRSASGAGLRLEDELFSKQLWLARHAGKRKVTRLPRRSGKTHSAGGILIEGAVTEPYANQGYITTTLKNAKKLVWPVIKRLNDKYQLGGIANDQEGWMRFPDLPNQPNIYLGGVANRAEIDKVRGWEGGAKRFIIDEAQAIRTSILEELIDDAIEPALLDYDGELLVYGTPGPVKSGFFHDIDIGPKRKGWDHFFWTIHDNPWLERKSGKKPAQILAELRERRGWTEDHPTYVREYLGQWVNDADALVFKFGAVNHLEALPDERMTYVIGVDMGFEDADAIAVLGWTPHDSTVYLVDEKLTRKQGITELAQAIRELYDKYRPIKLVGDFGGLGKKIGEEITRRFGLPIEAADKVRKFEHIELLNDATRTGRFKADPGSAFAQDCAIVQWDQKARAEGKLKIAEDFHSDITDAVLYAFRACYGYLARPAPAPPADEGEALIRRLYQEQQRGRHGDPIAAMLGYDD